MATKEITTRTAVAVVTNKFEPPFRRRLVDVVVEPVWESDVADSRSSSSDDVHEDDASLGCKRLRIGRETSEGPSSRAERGKRIYTGS